MKYKEIKKSIKEAEENFTVIVNFVDGSKLQIKNISQQHLDAPTFDSAIKKHAEKTYPNKDYRDHYVVGANGQKVVGTGEPEKFEPSEEAELAMKNTLDLHRLILNTMEKTVWKDLKLRKANDPKFDQGWYYLPRSKDHSFPSGISFTYKRTYPVMDGKEETIDDISEAVNGIDVIVNTKNPSRDSYGYQMIEGFPATLGDYDDMKQMVIDAVGARDHVTTVGPPQPEQKPNEPLKIRISAKSFYYRDAIVANPENN